MRATRSCSDTGRARAVSGRARLGQIADFGRSRISIESSTSAGAGAHAGASRLSLSAAHHEKTLAAIMKLVIALRNAPRVVTARPAFLAATALGAAMA